MALVRFEIDRNDAPGSFSENDGTADLTKDLAIVYDAAIGDISQLDIIDHAKILAEHYESIGLATDTGLRRLAMPMHSGSNGIIEEAANANDMSGEHVGLEIDASAIRGAQVADLVERMTTQIGEIDFPRP